MASDSTASAADKSSGIFSCTLKRTGQFALGGAAVGAIGALIAQAIPGVDVVTFFSDNLGIALGNSGFLGSFLTGALAGGALGVITGVPVGYCEGTSLIESRPGAALQREYETGRSAGMAPVMHLEPETGLYGQPGREYRDAIARRSGNHAHALTEEQAQMLRNAGAASMMAD